MPYVWILVQWGRNLERMKLDFLTRVVSHMKAHQGLLLQENKGFSTPHNKAPRLWAQLPIHGLQCVSVSSHPRSYIEHLKARSPMRCTQDSVPGKRTVTSWRRAIAVPLLGLGSRHDNHWDLRLYLCYLLPHFHVKDCPYFLKGFSFGGRSQALYNMSSGKFFPLMVSGKFK